MSTSAESNYKDSEVEKFASYVRSAARLSSLEIAGTNLSMILGHHELCADNKDFK